MTAPSHEQPDEAVRRDYCVAGSRAAPKYIATRTAERFAAFFLPHLRPGMALLDCGCGPGSITVGLARAVAPGQAVGIDLDPRRIELTQAYAAEQDVPNLRFETANIYTLPFPDDSFDAVFTTSVVMYLRDPLAALREMHRVLKPGGVVGIREPDHEGILYAPFDPLLTRFIELFDALVKHKGGNPAIGKQLGGLARQAGLVDVRATATFEVFSTPEARRQWGGALGGMVREENFIQQFVELGAERAELEQIGQAWMAWIEHPDGFYADPFCEVVGWKA